jgi:hypothetical protein
MDFLIDLLVQFILQVVVEVIVEAIGHGLAHAFRTRMGRYALTAVVGFAFGVGWGWHLASQPHPPKLLWVSIGLAVATLPLALWKRGAYDASELSSIEARWRRAFASPKRWPPDRWMDFAVLNAALAVGILGGYSLG